MRQKRIGALLVALAAVCWSFAGVLGKSLPWSAFTLNGIRSLVAVLLLALSRGTFRVKVTKGTLLGAVGVSMTGILFMAANKLTSAANAIVLQYAMPAVVIAFSWIFYGQRPTRRQLVIAACIMLGVVLCSWEGLSGGNPLGDALAILSAVTFALVFFCARIPGTRPLDYSYLGLMIGACGAAYAFFDPSMTLKPLHWLTVLGLGLCLAGGYFFISLSMSRVSPVSAALLSNLEPILNPLWVFLFLGERPGALTLLGAAIVLTAATVYALLPAEEG